MAAAFAAVLQQMAGANAIVNLTTANATTICWKTAT